MCFIVSYMKRLILLPCFYGKYVAGAVVEVEVVLISLSNSRQESETAYFPKCPSQFTFPMILYNHIL